MKAEVAAAIGAIGGVLTFLVAYFPDNDDVQLWGGLILGILTVLATAYGVYAIPNTATGPAVTPPGPAESGPLA
jgi:ammonia channel protein AmtB